MPVGELFGMGEQGLLWIFLSYGFLIFFFIAWNKLQVLQWLRSIEHGLRKLEAMVDESFRTSVRVVKEVGKPEGDPVPHIRRFMDYAFIEPTSLDPAGVVWKLDHLLNVRETRFREETKALAPKASPSQRNNLENLLEATADLNLIYKVVRHFYLLGKRTRSMYVVMQIHMIMPLIMQVAEAYMGAVNAFAHGYPIGDGAGALVAARLMRGPVRKIGEDMVMAERLLQKRRAIILKSEGPGGNVGKPGDALKTVIEQCGGKASMMVLVDAQLKFEGEKTGTVAEGVGAAIGGIGTEKYKIEEVALKYKIPLYAVLIKESIQEAISPMKKEIVDGIEEAVKAVKRLILERTKEGDVVIITGIGNTIGIGQ